MIKAILFDIDGVLFDSFEANHAFYGNLFAKTKYEAPTEEEYRGMYHMTIKDVVAKVVGEEKEEDIKKMIELVKDTPYPLNLVKLPLNSREVIKQLAIKYKLGLVTGRIERGLNNFFELSGLKEYFSVAICFEHYENPKPHPEPLLLALKQIQVKAEEAAYVGDAPTDFQCALAAGTEFIRFGDWEFEGPRFATKDFLDLPKLIENL